MDFLKIHFLRCINAVGCIKKWHAPRCIHKMKAILSVYVMLALLLVILNEIKSFILLYLRNCRRRSAGPTKSVYFLCNSFSLCFSAGLKTNFGWEHMRIIFGFTRFSLRWIINNFFLIILSLLAVFSAQSIYREV